MKKLLISSVICGLLTSCTVPHDSTYTDQELRDFVQTEAVNSMNFPLQQVGWNKLLHIPKITAYEDKFVVRPNNDTLYTMVMIDIEEGYAVLQFPETDRYISALVYDLEHYILDGGVLINETRPIIFVKKGNPIPDIDGIVIKSELGVVSPIIRTLVRGADDIPAAHAVQQQITLTKVGDEKHTGLMQPVLKEDKFKEMREFFRERTGSTSWDDMYGSRTDNIPMIDLAQGVYEGLGAFPAYAARYVSIFHDTDGSELHASRQYSLVVPADIPVNNFWSVTVYDDDGLLIPHEERIHNSSSEISVKNRDGSTTITFGQCTPEINNCIPTGDGDWNFTWRYYGPEGAIADGTWVDIVPTPVK
jgi:hypothetical protein